MVTPLLLTPEQAATELGIGRTAVFGLLKSGELRSIKVGRCRRVPRADLAAFVDRLRQEQGVDAGVLV